MLRSVFTLNRTECNRVRREARYNPKPLSDLRGVGRSGYRPAPPPRTSSKTLSGFACLRASAATSLESRPKVPPGRRDLQGYFFSDRRSIQLVHAPFQLLDAVQEAIDFLVGGGSRGHIGRLRRRGRRGAGNHRTFDRRNLQRWSRRRWTGRRKRRDLGSLPFRCAAVRLCRRTAAEDYQQLLFAVASENLEEKRCCRATFAARWRSARTSAGWELRRGG